MKPERRDLYEIRKRDSYDLVDRDNLGIEERDASRDEIQILRKRNSVPFVMGGPPAVARFPAQTLTTHGLGGCWVVAIVDKTTGVANHIPHGQMGHSPGGSVCQTVTSAQQAALQMPQLLNKYHANHLQGAMAYVLKHASASEDGTRAIMASLTGAGLSVKTGTYTSETQGDGNVVISGNGHSDPVMTLDGKKVIT